MAPLYRLGPGYPDVNMDFEKGQVIFWFVRPDGFHVSSSIEFMEVMEWYMDDYNHEK